MTAPKTGVILVVDDEPDILSELSDYLRRRGESVISASSYSAAVREFTENAQSIALVLTDVRMPDGNGVDLARLVIKQSSARCPCMLMTGHLDQAGLGVDLEAVGVTIYDKPFGLSAIHASVKSVIAGWPLRPPMTPNVDPQPVDKHRAEAAACASALRGIPGNSAG